MGLFLRNYLLLRTEDVSCRACSVCEVVRSTIGHLQSCQGKEGLNKGLTSTSRVRGTSVKLLLECPEQDSHFRPKLGMKSSSGVKGCHLGVTSKSARCKGYARILRGQSSLELTDVESSFPLIAADRLSDMNFQKVARLYTGPPLLYQLLRSLNLPLLRNDLVSPFHHSKNAGAVSSSILFDKAVSPAASHDIIFSK